MAAIQEVSARIERVTGCRIPANLRRCYPRWLLMAVIGLTERPKVAPYGLKLFSVEGPDGYAIVFQEVR